MISGQMTFGEQITTEKPIFLKAPVVVESLDEKTVTCQVCG